KEAALRSVRPLATPERAIGRGQRLAVWHHLVDVLLMRRPVGGVAGDRFAVGNGADDRIAALHRLHRIARDDPAVVGATAPFAGRILVGALVDPDVVGGGGTGQDERERKGGSRGDALHGWPP